MVFLCSRRERGRTGENGLHSSGRRGEVDASFSGGAPKVYSQQQ